MDAYTFILRQHLGRQAYKEQIADGERQMIQFYRMRRDAQQCAMDKAVTTMAYQKAKVAHAIYVGIISDLEACLGMHETPASGRSQNGSFDR